MLLNFTVGQEIKSPTFTGSISEANYNMFHPGIKSGILYGLCKFQKKCIDNCTPFRSILSATSTPLLAKLPFPLLSVLTHNEHTVHDSFSFDNDITEQNGTHCQLVIYQHSFGCNY